MTEQLFIDPAFVKRYTNLNQAVLDDYFSPVTLVTQDVRIHPLLGTDLYEKLKADVSGSSLAGDYLTLMNDYVVKALLWWFMYDLSEDMFTKLDNGGLVIRTSDQTTPSTREDLNARKKQYKSRASYYEDRLVTYLCNNSNLFPEYTTNSDGDISPTQGGIGNIVISDGYQRPSY